MRWGYLLGFLLWTPYRWWQRQHSLHHANNGNLDKRGPGEVRTMTIAEYRSARAWAGWATACTATRCCCWASARAWCSCSSAGSRAAA